MENLRKQLFPENCTTTVPKSLLTTNPGTQKHHANIETAKRRINDGLLTTESLVLLNPYAERKATKQEQEDLMNFREIGEKEFEKYVEYNILHKPSTNAPNRKRKLLTFSHHKANKTPINQLEKDKQLIMKCLQKRLKWYQQTGKTIERLAEQYIPFPLAISDNKGNPIKGQKSFTTKVFETRYKDSPYPVTLGYRDCIKRNGDKTQMQSTCYIVTSCHRNDNEMWSTSCLNDQLVSGGPRATGKRKGGSD